MTEIEEETPRFQIDHSRALLKGVPFTPKIGFDLDSQDSNVLMITLAATLDDDLDWKREIDLAKEAISMGKMVLWELDLGLSERDFSFEDEMGWSSYLLAIREFEKTIWSAFEEESLGVSFGQISLEFHSFIARFPRDSGIYETPEALHIHCAKLLSDYLHRLVAELPFDLPAYIRLDISAIKSPTFAAALISKEIFEHIQVIAKSSSRLFGGISEGGNSEVGFLGSSRELLVAQIALLIPTARQISLSSAQKLDTIGAQLAAKNLPFRTIPETLFTEQWDGINLAIVLPELLTPKGERALSGFIAAGGEVLRYCGLLPTL